MRCFVLIGILTIFTAGVAQAQVTRTGAPSAAIVDSTCTGVDGSGGPTDTIFFPETGSITDVNVRVAIDHTFRSDLQMHVTYTGGGGTVILAADHGGFAENDYYATFDDEGAGPCSTACGSGATACSAVGAPGPTCQPDTALTAFDALASPGTWTFALCDDAGGDTGTWQTWAMTVDGTGQLPVELMRFTVE